MNDAELVGDVLAGRTERFDALVSRYVGLARGLCASLVRDAAARDDVVQDSFVYAYTHLESLRDRRRFGPWLCSIVRNKSRDWLRSNKRREANERNLASQQGASPATPEDALIGEELRDWVRAQLSTLPERTREAMFLCYVEGMDQKEAAAFLGISIAALKKRLQYGRDRISERIWRDLENADRPKRDHAKLAGAIMVAVQTAPRPAAAGGTAVGLKAAVLAMPRAAIVGALTLLLVAGTAIYTMTARETVARETTVTAAPAGESRPEIAVETVLAQAPDPEPVFSAVAPETPPVPGQSARGITGVVISMDSREPIERVEVEALMYGNNGMGMQPRYTATTDADGAFAFPTVDPESEFSLRLGWPHRYASEPFTRTFGRGPQPEHYVIEARSVGAITGYVRDPDGNPVGGATILRAFPFGHSSHQYATTGPDGRFGFSQDGGVWRLQAKGRMGNDSEVVVLDLVQGDVVEQDFELPRGASIHLTLTGPVEPTALVRAEVAIERVYPELLDTGAPKVMDSYSGLSKFIRKGNVYTLPLLAEGAYTITLDVPGFAEAVAGPFVIGPSLEHHFAEIALNPTEPIEPPEAEHAGGAVELVSVSAQDGLGNPLDTGGLFYFAIDDTGELHDHPNYLDPGTYWTAAVKEGYGADIRLQLVGDDSGELTFVLGGGGTIYGSVANSDVDNVYVLPLEVWEAGAPTTEARDPCRGFRPLGEALAQGAAPADDRSFTLPPLPAGWYVVLTDEQVSEPVEVREGHATGPVLLSTGPAAAEE